ncbi:MAG: flavoprotein [Gammaproteobacteria bacterium]|nr:flavoprotein [Gammaproteobacteria bacterium]MBT6734609.1 flavoprotein [Gammaproteobacteria bacterium]MBT7236248.1 flavoprotein [Gammaproteobacteria bacterium]
MNDKKRIAWCITGSGHYLKESIEIILTLKNVDLFLSKAGEEVLKWYDYSLEDFKSKGIKVFKDITSSSAPVSLLYEGVYKLIIVSPTTSNTIAKMSYGLSDSLITNMFAQAGKCKIHSIVFACDTEPTVITQAPKKSVTLYPRDIELENYEKLKKFKNVDVVDDVVSLNKALGEWI